MRRIAVVLVGVLMLGVVASAQFVRSHKERGDKYTFTVATDTAKDSTIGSFVVGNMDDATTDGFRGLYASIILAGPTETVNGAGNDDSGWIWLEGYWERGRTTVIDSVVCGGLPCSLVVEISEDSAQGDLLFAPRMGIRGIVYDSLADTMATIPYRVDWYIYLH